MMGEENGLALDDFDFMPLVDAVFLKQGGRSGADDIEVDTVLAMSVYFNYTSNDRYDAHGDTHTVLALGLTSASHYVMVECSLGFEGRMRCGSSDRSSCIRMLCSDEQRFSLLGWRTIQSCLMGNVGASLGAAKEALDHCGEVKGVASVQVMENESGK